MARARRVDGNQVILTRAIREKGYSVSITSSLGSGFPDLVVGAEGISIVGNVDEIISKLKDVQGLRIIRGVNLILELKDDTQPPSKRKLTSAEEKWHKAWKGQKIIIENEQQIDDLLKPLDIS